MIPWLKTNPEKAVFGVPGAGSIPHLYGLEFNKAAGLDMRMLQLRGGAPIATEVLAGNIPLGLAGTGDFAQLHKDGKIRMVAVSGTRRAPGFNDVPTFAEQGFAGLEYNGRVAFFAPPDLAPETQKTFNSAIVTALASPEIAAKLTEVGFVPTPGRPEDLTARIERDLKKWDPLIAASGVRK